MNKEQAIRDQVNKTYDDSVTRTLEILNKMSPEKRVELDNLVEKLNGAED